MRIAPLGSTLARDRESFRGAALISTGGFFRLVERHSHAHHSGVAEIVVSKNGVPIRLTDERWIHITEEDTEPAGYRLEVLETHS